MLYYLPYLASPAFLPVSYGFLMVVVVMVLVFMVVFAGSIVVVFAFLVLNQDHLEWFVKHDQSHQGQLLSG